MKDDEARALLEGEAERLRALRAQADATFEEARDAVGSELTTSDQHDADVATELHEQEVSQTVLEQLDAGLAAVDDAYARLERGSYGQCEHCGQPIPDERLRARPAARFCVAHEPDARELGADSPRAARS